MEEEPSPRSSETTNASDFRQEPKQVIVAEPISLVGDQEGNEAPALKGKRQTVEQETTTTNTQCETQTQPCSQELESNLRKTFYLANRDNSPVVQKVRQGDYISHVGSVELQKQALETDCIDEIRLDFDANRFPQYLMQTTCLESPGCNASVVQRESYLKVLRLDPTQCNNKGNQKYYVVPTPHSIVVCTRVKL